MGTRIRLKPKGQDGPIIEGELEGSGVPYGNCWAVRLAPGVTYNSFPQEDWEEVFELPTKRYAVVEGFDHEGNKHVFMSTWRPSWTHPCKLELIDPDEIMSDYTDHRVVFEGEE